MKCKCNREFNDSQLFCPDDGEILGNDIVLNGKWLIKEKIGLGGMGFVYRAEHKLLKHSRAIKILRQGISGNIAHSQHRFEREAKVLAKLEHRNIVKIEDFVVDSSHIYFVMELLHGEDLAQRIKSVKTFSPQEALEIIVQICSAVSYAHEKGVLHRDLKSSNIFLVSSGDDQHVKVLDFGVAKILDPEVTKITKTNMIIGTPSYMSPEQFKAEKDIDRRTDIYSIGIILYEILCGKVPFEGGSFLEIGLKHANEQPRPISESGVNISDEVEQVVQRALSKKRSDRQNTAMVLAEELNDAIQKADESVQATIPAKPPSQPPPLLDGPFPQGVIGGMIFHNPNVTNSQIIQGVNTININPKDETPDE